MKNQKHNVYATIGDNGYCMSDNWSENSSLAGSLDNFWHHGFDTEEEAYEWLSVQVAMRWPLKKYGICDLDTLRKKKMILIEEAKNTELKPTMQYVTLPKKSLKEVLDEDDNDDDISLPRGRTHDFKQELIKAFDAWLTDCMEKMNSKS